MTLRHLPAINALSQNFIKFLCLLIFFTYWVSSANAQQCQPPNPPSPPSPPSVSATTGPGYKTITVSTSLPGDGGGTTVYASSDGTNFSALVSFNINSPSTSYTWTGLDTNKTYYFKGVSNNSCGSSGFGGTASATTLDINPPTISATTGSVHKTINVATNLPPGVDSTTIYASSNGTNFSALVSFNVNSPSTSYTWTGLDTNKTYYFYAIATSGSRQKQSGTTSATTLDINPPTISATTGPGYKTITVSTNIPLGADGTTIYASSNGTNFSALVSFNINSPSTSYTWTGLDTNKTYYFYAITTSGSRQKQSSTTSATTLDTDPPTISAMPGPGYKTITVSTNIPPGTDGTTIYASSNGTNFSALVSFNVNSPSTSYTWTGLDTNKTYYFYAIATSGSRQKQSGTTSATTLDINPPSISAVAGPGEGAITVSTNIPPGADGTTIYASSNGTNFSALVSFNVNSPSTSYTWTGLANNTTYYFYAVTTSGSRQKQSGVVSVTLGEDQDAGPESCSTGRAPNSVGYPVNVTNGNMYLQQTDYNLPGIGENINVTRTYNSIIQRSGWFGFGWSTQYDENIIVQSNYSLRLALADGRAVYFGRGSTTAPFTPSTPDFYGDVVKNADNTFTLTFKDGRIHQFNAVGRLTSLKDRNGIQTTLTYNASNQLIKITDSFARVLTVTPNAAGYIGQISDSIGVVATYAYNPNGTLLSVTYPDNSKYQFEYTTIGSRILLTTVKDAYDNILEKHEYDSSGRATTSEKHGGVEKYTLDYSNVSYTQVTDALGRVTKYYYDKNSGRRVVTKIEGNCNCGSGSQVTNYEYDAKLNLTKQTDALGRITTYTYDANGNRLTMTDVLGTETYTYNLFGQTLTSKDRMNGTTTNTFDTKGNLLTTKNALDKTTTFTYTPLGQLSTVKDARNNTTTLTYDTVGRLSTVKDADNKITTYGYDARARITSVKNALNETTAYGYDLNNRLNKITYPDTKFVSYGYDLAGRRTTMTDARGKITTYGYDPAYRLISVKDPLNHITTFGYDLMSNRTSVTDALGNTTNYEFDTFDRPKKIIYPPAIVGGSRLAESIEYDTVGNVKKRIDTTLRETLYAYDAANRLETITDADLKVTQFDYNARSQMTKVTDALNQIYDFSYDPLGRLLSQERAGSKMAYEYDQVGNRISRTDYNNTQTTYTYDVLNRLKTIGYPVSAENVTLNYDSLSRLTSAVNQNGTVSFTYDNRGRTATTTDVWGKILTYGYDNNGNRNLLKLDAVNYAAYGYDDASRLTNLTNSADAAVINFGYDNANKLTSRNYPNGVATTYNYDGMSRLTRLKDLGTAVNFDRQYFYNTANQINSIIEPTLTRNMGYDNLDRLTSVTPSTGTQESYQFDGVGNRTSSHLSNTYSYQPNNQLTATDGSTFGYDDNGNLTSRTDFVLSWSYEWDAENRLKRAAKSSGESVVYKYDALGRRIQRVPNTGVATKFTYDGADVLLDQNSDGTTIKYLNGAGVDNKLRQTTSSGTASYFLADHLGSTNALVNTAGAITSQTNYDAFGNQTSALATHYSFTGRERDDLTGLMHYRARQYSPGLGRFISEDPIGFAGGDVNLYGYVANKPLSSTDPSGQNALALPFLALGPPGWVVAGGIVVTTVAIAGIVYYNTQTPPFPSIGNLPYGTPPFPNQSEKSCDAKPRAIPMSPPLPTDDKKPDRQCKQIDSFINPATNLKHCIYECKERIAGGFSRYLVVKRVLPDQPCPQPDPVTNWIPDGI